VLRAGELALDPAAGVADLAGTRVRLSRREAELLATFLRHPGQVLSREQLLFQTWGYDRDPDSNLVPVYVGYLREKLGHGVIKTVPGLGYRLDSAPGRSGVPL
jgi:DNA-binding response OmpR family regulator